MESNTKLGVSTYDYHYNACRCCSCNDIVALTPETLEKLVQEEIDRLNRENAYNDYFFLSEPDKQKIRARLDEQSRGFQLDYDQCIHYSCLATLEKPENAELLQQIRLANRRNMILPDQTNYYIYPLSYTDVEACLNICGYCQAIVASQAPGFAYWLKSDKYRRARFLHTDCYNGLLFMRQQIRERETLIRRHFIHLLTRDDTEEQWSNYSIREMAERNDQWYEFLSKYELTFDEREVLNRWLQFISNQKPQWSETQSFREWLSTLREDDLSQLVDEELRNLTDVELATLQEQVEKQIEQQAILPQCPPSTTENAGLLCFQPPQPSGRQPARLFLNLVKTVRQSLITS